MAIKLNGAVSCGLVFSATLLLSACGQQAETNVPVSDASNTTVTDPATSSSPASEVASSTPSADLTSAFPIPESAKKADSAAPTVSVPVQLVDADEYKAVVEKHKGKVVLVDCWATWCGPCTEQFPHTVELGRKHAEQGLAVISVSFNDPEQLEDVSSFLAKQNAGFDHLISKFGASVESFVKFEIEGGALPYYKLYDRTGALRYQFCGDNENLKNVLKIEELDKRLEELLAEKT